MTGRIRRASRTVQRLGALGWEFARMACEFLNPRGRPADILHRASIRILRLMKVDVEFTGSLPGAGVVVANHLGYLDILVLSAIAPARFVAKSDVARWPVLGWFARRAGCVFVARGDPFRAAESVTKIDSVLSNGSTLVLFPEGTSSGGASVLPFRSALLEPARRRAIWAAALEYSLDPDDGDPAEVVCYWKDMSLAPHLVRLLGRRRIVAKVRLAPASDPGLDRKALARSLHAQVEGLRLERATASAGL